jgi:copper homeostasis protein
LIEQAGDRIIIMPGSGVRADNIIDLAKRTNAKEFHSSARILKNSSMTYTNDNMKEDLRSVLADSNEIERMAANLKSL